MPGKGANNSATGSTSNPSGRAVVTWGLRSKQDTTSPQGSTHVITMPQDMQRGDALFMFVSCNVGADINTPTGFTLIKSVEKNCFVFTKSAILQKLRHIQLIRPYLVEF